MRFLLLIPLAAVSLTAQTQPGIAAPWDVSQAVAALSDQAARLNPILAQLTPREWVAKGAPDAYVAQWESAQQELGYLADSARSLEKQPEKLTAALDTFFRLQAVEWRLQSLVEGVRKYQNPAIGDLLEEAIGANTSNRDHLRDYITELAAQKEGEFTVVEKEAQRCRAEVNKTPARTAPAASSRNRK
jgi:hypothetical protein